MELLPLTILASVLVGFAVAMALRGVILAALPQERAVRSVYHFDETRRERLREASSLYRYASGLIDRLARWNAQRLDEAIKAKFAAELKASGLPAPWLPEEYVAVNQLQATLVGIVAAGLASIGTESVITGAMLGVMIGFVVYVVTIRDAGSKAAERRRELLGRLPFVLDLIALMMASGSGFQDALEAAVEETKGHPLGDELAEVLRDIRFNRPRREALLNFEDRVGDPAVSELVFAIVKGEELGTPLGVAIRQQADQMRIRRSQILEKEAAEAQVAIVFPGFVIMIACVLIVTAPFVLRALEGSDGMFG
jgi:tight adherence protein C